MEQEEHVHREAMTFGAILRESRKAAGFGLRELCKKVEISPAYLSDIELGRRLPSDDVLLALASAIGHAASSSDLRDAVIDARISVLRDRITTLEATKLVKRPAAKQSGRKGRGKG